MNILIRRVSDLMAFADKRKTLDVHQANLGSCIGLGLEAQMKPKAPITRTNFARQTRLAGLKSYLYLLYHYYFPN